MMSIMIDMINIIFFIVDYLFSYFKEGGCRVTVDDLRGISMFWCLLCSYPLFDFHLKINC